MAKYYNKTRGPVSVALLNGETIVFAAKTYTEVAREQEGSPALIRARRSGRLVRMAVPEVVVEKVAPVVAKPKEVPEVKGEPKVKKAEKKKKAPKDEPAGKAEKEPKKKNAGSKKKSGKASKKK